VAIASTRTGTSAGGKGGNEVGLPADLDLRRQAAIAVVESDHAEASVDESVAERVRPRHELHAEPHDQQDRRRRRIAERFVLDRDAVRRDCRHVPNRPVAW
jgi:hypothetical protein